MWIQKKKKMSQVKEQIEEPEIIQLSNEQIANLSDAQFKTLVIRMLTELVEFGRKLDEKMKAVGRWEDGGQIGGSGVHFPSTPVKYLADLRNRANSQRYSSIYEDWRPR